MNNSNCTTCSHYLFELGECEYDPISLTGSMSMACDMWGNRPKKADIDSKPFICLRLDVEVGERFKIEGYSDEIEFWILMDSTYQTSPPNQVNSSVALLTSLEHPSRIIRKPRWTERDEEDARIIRRVFGGTQIGVMRESSSKLRTIGKDGYPNECINCDMFPSLKAGEKVMLNEIIGGKE